VLAELIERTTGVDFRDFVEQRVTSPLGLPRILGLSPDQATGALDLQLCGEAASAEELQEIFGIAALPETEVTDDALMALAVLSLLGSDHACQRGQNEGTRRSHPGDGTSGRQGVLAVDVEVTVPS
jgi:CubicO group peptidase (beta-lactamase class C family)